jgi:alpha-glucosidase (family GH31 glycosyl hydrolase)
MHAESPREPWYFGERANKIIRKFTILRYQLFPYLYSTALEAESDGLPILRSMPLEFPDDPQCYFQDHQYMFGPAMLIAPVIRQDNFCSIYLPKGIWFDFFKGTQYEGPMNLKRIVPLATMPIFIKAGSMIPEMQKLPKIPENEINPLIINIYPAEQSRYQYREDKYSNMLSCEKKSGFIKFEFNFRKERDFQFKFYNIYSYREVFLEISEKQIEINSKHITQKKRFLQVSLQKMKQGTILIKLGN